MGSLFPAVIRIPPRSPIAKPWLGQVLMIISLPGCIFSIMIAGNVHDFPTWAVVVGNVAFYFGLTYLILTIAAKRRSKGRLQNRPLA